MLVVRYSDDISHKVLSRYVEVADAQLTKYFVLTTGVLGGGGGGGGAGGTWNKYSRIAQILLIYSLPDEITLRTT